MARNTILMILLGAIAVAAVMVALGGCSGAGASTPTVSGASVQAAATDQLTGALTTRGWMNVMYRGVGGSGIRPASVKPRPVNPSLVQPRDGIAFEDSGTNSDGSTWHYVFYDPDWDGYEDVTWPDGATRHMTWGVSIDDGPAPGLNGDNAHQDYTETWSDGTTLAYTYATLFSAADPDYQTWVGTAHMAGGKTASYTIARHYAYDFFTITYGDGTVVAFTVQVRVITNVAVFAPDFSAGATGTITGPAGKQAFTLSGQNSDTVQPGGTYGYWNTMVLTAPDGATSTMTLGNGFSAAGQIASGGQLVGTLSWDTTVTGTLHQVGMDAAAISPSDAARRLAVDRFIYSTAAMEAGATW